VDETEYWRSLRFRINSVSSDTPSRRLALPGWCDWFEPRKYVFDGPSPRITGRVGFVGGRDAWERRFVLLLSGPFNSSSEIEWGEAPPVKGFGRMAVVGGERPGFFIDPCYREGSIGEPSAPADGGRDFWYFVNLAQSAAAALSSTFGDGA